MDRAEVATGGLVEPVRYQFGDDRDGCFIPRVQHRDPDTRAALLAQAASWYGATIDEQTKVIQLNAPAR
jgi:hypothetical protein